MKILRAIVRVIVIVGGIVLASANTTAVTFVYQPALPFLQRPEGSQQVPLALLLLAALVVGSLVTGTGTFVEHVRLRMAVRTQRKRNDKLGADLDKLRAELESVRSAADTRGVALASEQEKVRRAEEAAAKASDELAHERERAEQAESRALAAERQGGVDSGVA
ncbi:MAG: DUF1049 domain-containing protein [Deltaproteobacteria bacterium]|nr:DUF1049 domain-containing protein [Deltaproteobacteria bacterium]